MNIVILDGGTVILDDYTFDNLSEYGEVIYYENTPKELVIDRAKFADILIVNKIEIDADIIDNCANLKLIATLSTGYNVIDIAYAKIKNIPVCNIPDYSSVSVAQHTIALLLEATNNVGKHSVSVSNGDWQKCDSFCYTLSPQMELHGKTIGLIGYGNIGGNVAKICNALGMNVIANTQSMNSISGAELCNINELFSQSDVISLHCPLTNDNKQIINTLSIEKMKDNVIIINTSRGGLVDEDAVSCALSSGKISVFCADVLSIEPQSKSCAFLNNSNTIITPHIAWASHEARGRLLSILNNNIKVFLSGEIINCVN